MISIQNLSVEFSAKTLLDNISYVINRRDRIALVGKNGAGKSTMLKIIAGLQRPTSGTVAVAQDVTIGYLPQQMEISDSLTVVEEVRKAFAAIDDLHRKLDDLNQQLASRTDYESAEYHRLIDDMTSLSERIAMEESENMEAEMEKTLTGLGFDRSDFCRPTSEFSGGWRMRIELAKLLLRRPDVLLLDEPTNHLDIESIQWLEQFMVTKAKAVVLVSHDRAFIDNVTNRTIEISLGHIYDYAVSYSHFVELRRERMEQQMRAYQNQQKTDTGHRRIHRTLPLQGHKERTGAEPYQATGQNRAHRGGRSRHIASQSEISTRSAIGRLPGDSRQCRQILRKP